MRRAIALYPHREGFFICSYTCVFVEERFTFIFAASAPLSPVSILLIFLALNLVAFLAFTLCSILVILGIYLYKFFVLSWKDESSLPMSLFNRLSILSRISNIEAYTTGIGNL